MRVIAFALLLGMLAIPAEGQTIWSRPYEPNQVTLEALIPDASDNASALSGATFLTGTLSLNENVELVAELPVARYSASATDAPSTSAVGNPYLGFGFSGTRLPFLLQVGARMPTAPSNAATTVGQTADIGRTSAFRPDEWVLSGLLNGRFSAGQHSSLRLRIGFGYANYSPADRPSQVRYQDLRMYYDAQLWQEGDRLITGLSFTGRANLTWPGSTQHHLSLSLMGNWRRVQPGLVAGISLNDLFQNSTFVPIVGVTLSVTYMR